MAHPRPGRGRIFGAVAQLVERIVRNDEVGSSTLLRSTSGMFTESAVRGSPLDGGDGVGPGCPFFSGRLGRIGDWDEDRAARALSSVVVRARWVARGSSRMERVVGCQRALGSRGARRLSWAGSALRVGLVADG